MTRSPSSAKAVTKLRGDWAEARARQFLTAQGLSHMMSNYSAPCGELDLIMRDKHTLVFVEVRYRAYNKFGGALESIDQHKIRKLVRTAEHFLQRYGGAHKGCRFDAVLLSGPQSTPSLEWIKDAFNI
jgi:putative endonuclease